MKLNPWSSHLLSGSTIILLSILWDRGNFKQNIVNFQQMPNIVFPQRCDEVSWAEQQKEGFKTDAERGKETGATL